jgi:hypothetical protein
MLPVKLTAQGAWRFQVAGGNRELASRRGAHYCEAFAGVALLEVVVGSGVVLTATAAAMVGTWRKEKPVERQEIDDELSTTGAQELAERNRS